MNVLITGGTGLIGAAISNCISNDCNLSSIVRTVPLTSENIRFIQADLSLPKFIETYKNIRPDVVIHCAANIPSGANTDDEIYSLNCRIDENVISLCKTTNSALIYFSSTIVYGYQGNEMGISENHPTKTPSLYAKQKLESEGLIATHIPQHLILRVNAPYGRYMRQRSVMNIFADRAINNEDLFYHGNGERMQDFTNVEDIGRWIRSLIKTRTFTSGVFNISSGAPVTMKKLASLIVHQVENCKSRIIPSGSPDPQEAYKASYDISKAKKILGWNPQISLYQGLSDLIQNRKLI
ncbi:NAD(P)-dependent oxidoreductase [Chitinophaga lutea]|uniref:dTDP-4-dehydrorhamnose reductase n=1 Tax=Chitinophaga lutea TaxID=2488634 RepID=A0A3N4QB65_9BACT|nr:NAD(P)-dependent oxidoreductase [Chitinophaga lutea]RPE13230.1 NAD(P)-dependent oxidoreductase [Chitinophaga lutea]